jgi:hypothetical protein
MAVWSLTKNKAQRIIESTVRGARRGLAVITNEDRFAIFAAINEALIDISLERSIDVPKTVMSDTTVDTVASQNYVDLDSAVVNVVDGTVRIIAEGVILRPISISAFYALDPRENISSSWPTVYAIDTDGSGTMRLLLRDTPGAVYTINLKVESMPDEDAISDLPGWYHGMLRSLATAIALETLGLPVGNHQARYNERLKNIREKQRGRSGPQHLQVRPIRDTRYRRHPELRIRGGSV